MDFDINRDPHWFGLTDTLSLQGSEVLRASTLELQTFAKELSQFIDPQLKLEGLCIPHSSTSYINLAKAFHRHLIDLEKLCLSRHRGNWDHEPRDMSLAREPLYVTAESKSPAGNTLSIKNSISNVYERWRASDLL